MSEERQKSVFLEAVGRAFLAFDAFIDSSLFNAKRRAVAAYASYSAFLDRFYVSGVGKAAVEIACEGLTLGLAGALLALALALPAFRETSEEDWLKREDLAVTFLDRYGVEVGRRGIKHDDSIPFEQLPDHFIKAVLATEDRRFFDHFGIDVIGLFRAVTVNAQAGGVVQGGSTLTQQLAKNIFLTNERSLDRKVKEAFLAIWLEANLSKKEILSLYLDRTYMGGGTFGAAAASQFYFGKSITDVNLAEAAMLAGLFKAPTKYAPHVNLPAARARANDVLTNLVQSGLMTEGQVIAARRNPASVVDRAQIDSPDFFLDWAFDEVQRLSARFPERSLIVRTTIDMGLQKAAEDSVESSLMEYGERYHTKQGATVVIENGGAVRAMVGGRDYGESQFNRATKALRQPGSSFKIYTYSVAMERGMTPTSTIVDAPITWGNWSPHNYENRYSGKVTLTQAIAQSINTIPVRLAKEKFGIQPIRDMAKAMGVETPIRNDKTIPIGTSEVTVLDQATAYAVFPADGMQSHRHGIAQIMGYNGKVLYDFSRDEPPAKRVLTEKANSYMNQMLTQIPLIGTGRKAALDRGIVVGGKTGTTQAYRDAWFIGFTGNYTCAVWFGNDDYTSTNNMTGGTLPAMTFKKIMDYAHQGIVLKPIPGIDNPFPAQKPQTVATKKATTTTADNAPPPLIRPRTLSVDSTRILRDLGEKLRAAAPLATQKVAAAE